MNIKHNSIFHPGWSTSGWSWSSASNSIKTFYNHCPYCHFLNTFRREAYVFPFPPSCAHGILEIFQSLPRKMNCSNFTQHSTSHLPLLLCSMRMLSYLYKLIPRFFIWVRYLIYWRWLRKQKGQLLRYHQVLACVWYCSIAWWKP